MKIDKKLNFVVPIYADAPVPTGEKGADGKPIMVTPVVAHVHSMPLGAEIAERYFLILAQTFSGVFNLGLGIAGGPGVAMRLLKKIAVEQQVWADEPKTSFVGVENGLLMEIRRLTSVLAKVDNAWRPVPLATAVERGILSVDDQAEVENAIVFFIVVSATLGRAQRKEMLEAACGLWDARVSLLSSTEYANSLPTLTVTANSGAKPPTTEPQGQVANATQDGKPSSVPG